MNLSEKLAAREAELHEQLKHTLKMVTEFKTMLIKMQRYEAAANMRDLELNIAKHI